MVDCPHSAFTLKGTTYWNCLCGKVQHGCPSDKHDCDQYIHYAEKYYAARRKVAENVIK